MDSKKKWREEKYVISGISGKFPKSENVAQFLENLISKADLLSTCFEHKRHSPMLYSNRRLGILEELGQFDYEFFKIQKSRVPYMEPLLRNSLESIIEALFDAGLSLEEIKGTNTGVYGGVSYFEGEKLFTSGRCDEVNLIDSCRCLCITHVSNFLQINGPTKLCDSACSSSLYAVHEAYKDLLEGRCDRAIIFGVNSVFNQNVSAQFNSLGVISASGFCKPFDADGDGYVRSECTGALIVERQSMAKREYVELVHCEANSDGFKEMGITYPSAMGQKLLLERFYADCPVPLNQIGFIEAHGTGTGAGDSEELKSIYEFFCKDRKDKLLVGSVKSNVGHSEPSSGIPSIIKCCLISHTGFIIPNLLYKKPRDSIKEYLNGCLKVVTELTPINRDTPYLAVDNFGFGGANGHLLLKIPTTLRVVSPLKKEEPMLVCVSGRHYEAVDALLDGIAKNRSKEFIYLIHSLFKHNIDGHHVRAFGILNTSGFGKIQKCKSYNEIKPLICLFSNEVINIGDELSNLTIWQAHLQKVREIFARNGLSSNNSFTSKNGTGENLLNTVIVQTGLIQIFKKIEIEMSQFWGEGVGQLSAAYADNVFNLEESILAAYYVARISHETDTKLKKEMTRVFKGICKVAVQAKKWLIVNKNDSLANVILHNQEKAKCKFIKKCNYLILGSTSNEKSNVLALSRENGAWDLLGRLYLLGYNPSLENLYEKPERPVIPETAMTSPLIKWQKNECTFDKILRNDMKIISNELISLNDYKWNFVEGHVIDGRVLFPATGYLFLVWQTVFPMHQSAIIFEEVRYLRACTIPKTGDLTLTVQINKYSGHFEVIDHDAVVVSGRVAFEQNVSDEWYDLEALPLPDSKNQISKKDIYKELNLRGYGYQKQFRELLDVDVNCTVGHIQWTHWVPFMDNMLQMKILEQDGRALFVPVKISKVIIDPVKHAMLMPYYKKNPTAIIPVYNYKDLNIIRSGFIEMRGLICSNLSKRKHPVPVLEVNKFVPYSCQLEINEAIRVIMQICLENSYTVHLKAAEVYTDVLADFQPILPMIQNALNDQPLIQHDLILYSNRKDLDIPGVSISSNVGNEKSCFMTIAFNLSVNFNLRSKLIKQLKPNGYLLSREPKTAKAEEEFENLIVIAQYWTGREALLLLQMKNEVSEKKPVQLDVASSGFTWLSQLQQARKNKDDILLISQNEANNGLLGLNNCIFREAGQEKITAFLIQDETAPKFDINSPLYQRQFKKRLSVNVLRNGIWGSYRHLLIAKPQTICAHHAIAHCKTKGDLSSLHWTEGPLSISNNFEFSKTDLKTKLVQIYASGVNFKDVMLTTGKISVENFVTDRRKFENSIGNEFVGKLIDGTRVMGTTSVAGISNYIQAESDLLFPIPDEMTMEEAATIPALYLTIIYGLIIRGNLRREESILIHSATGGIGMSALNVAIHYQCNIFVTVGTKEKKQFIMKTYPQIPEAHIGNSRDTSFYGLIMKETRGKGVDLLLNSLADEKLQSSVCCLSQKGRMIEIGKYDFFNDSQLQVELTKREAEYHGVMLDHILVLESNHKSKETLTKMFVSGFKEGFIKPIYKTVFEKYEIEQSFRYLTTGNHMGKVVIKIRDEETEKNIADPIAIVAEPRFHCDVTGVYIIAGGLGGCGLEIADWLVMKGATILILISRRGITSGYQSYRIKMWESRGVRVVISTDDITKRECCEQLLRSANKFGPVIGIFNLAVVLKDSIIENQTVETFQESYDPKARITINLDELTRILCPELKHFVVFSSVSCGRGNAGQTNYGYSNSVMERICERRKMEGLPGLAIQWGVIGDVGIVADYKEKNIELVIGGTLPQRISNCLETMELFMVSDEPIMSSFVVAEKKLAGSESSMVDVIAEALQIRDIKTVGHNLTLPEIGMDSIMAVEIKQKLEREFDLFLSPQELRNMTLAKLLEISMGEQEQLEDKSDQIRKNIDALREEVFPTVEHFAKGVVNLDSNGGESQTFFIPGVECTSMLLETVASNLKSSTKCLQFNYSNMKHTVYEYADELAKILENNCDPAKPIFLCSYSLGTSTAIEMLSIFERIGRNVVLIILDGSPEFNKSVITGESKIDVDNMDFDFFIILKILELVLPSFDLETNKFKEEIKSAKSWDERLRKAIKWTNAASTQYPEEHIFEYMSCINKRIRAELGYQMKCESFRSKVYLCKASIPIIKGLDEDYGLGKMFPENLKVKEFEGDHWTFLHNPELVNYIQEVINLNINSEKVIKSRDA